MHEGQAGLVRLIQFRDRVYANWLRKAAQQPSSAKRGITTGSDIQVMLAGNGGSTTH